MIIWSKSQTVLLFFVNNEQSDNRKSYSLDNITSIRFVVILSTYINPVLSNASLNVRNRQILQSGAQQSETRGYAAVKILTNLEMPVWFPRPSSSAVSEYRRGAWLHLSGNWDRRPISLDREKVNIFLSFVQISEFSHLPKRQILFHQLHLSRRRYQSERLPFL